MIQALRCVSQPIELGNVVAPNRIFMSGMHLGFERDANPYASMAAFFERRARGGVGMISVGGCSPDQVGAATRPHGFTIASDDLIVQHQTITSSIHRHGSLAILQLCPFGREAFHKTLIAPTPIKAHSNPFCPKKLTSEDISQNIEDFVGAICRSQEAGYDGVEIVGSQGFLIHQFLAPRTNQRTDKWGGDFAGRSRYARELVRKSIAATNGSFPLIFRMPACDYVEGGVTREEALSLTSDLAKEGVSMFNVGIGWHDAPIPTISMEVPAAAFSPLAFDFRDATAGTPVITSNRINDLRVAERVLEQKYADVIAIGRPLLADPDLVNKSIRRQWRSVNTCIACNQECLDKALTGRRVGCVVNPQCSYEFKGEVSAPAYLSGKRKMAVIGGGPAGMSAALWLQRCGIETTLYEGRYTLGGQLRMAKRIPGKEIFHETIRYFENELYDSGVDIRLGKRWTEEHAKRFDGDHMVIAAGALPRRPMWLENASGNVLSYEDIILENLPLGGSVAIVGSGAISVDLVKFCKQRNQQWIRDAEEFLRRTNAIGAHEKFSSSTQSPSITVISRSRNRRMGATIGVTTRWYQRAKIEDAAKIIGGVSPLSYNDGILTLEDEAGLHQELKIDTLIYAIGQIEDIELSGYVENSEIPHTILGLRCNKISRYSVGHAIKQGYNAALELAETTTLKH